MVVSRRLASDKLLAYRRGDLPLLELVHWAEDMLAEEVFEDGFEGVLMDVLGYVGAADVEGFELTPEIVDGFLRQLGGESAAGVLQSA